MIKGSDALKVLVTGTAGFIGFHLAKLLLSQGCKVHGYDGITDYYDVNLKRSRHKVLHTYAGFSCTIGMLEDSELLNQTFDEFQPDVVVHLAAQLSCTALKIREHILNPISSALLT